MKENVKKPIKLRNCCSFVTKIAKIKRRKKSWPEVFQVKDENIKYEMVKLETDK